MTVRIDEPVPPGESMTDGGLRFVVNCEKLKRDIVPANPFRLARLIPEVSDPPGASVRWVFAELIVKSGPLTITDMSREWNNVQPPVASMNTVLLPGEALLGIVIVSVELAVPPEASVTMGGFKETGSEGNENEKTVM